MMSKEYELRYALHRVRMDMMENILRVTNEGAKKTHIMYRCNLSFKQLNAYQRRFLKNISVVEYLGTRNTA
jgi:predicted transcriptional regulator